VTVVIYKHFYIVVHVWDADMAHTWQRISVSKNWSSSRIVGWVESGVSVPCAAAAICLINAGLLWSPGNSVTASARWSSIRDPCIDAIMSRNSSSSTRVFAVTSTYKTALQAWTIQSIWQIHHLHSYSLNFVIMLSCVFLSYSRLPKHPGMQSSISGACPKPG